TYNNYTYINKIKRQGKEKNSILEIVTVDENMQRSAPANISFEWPSYPKPKADFEVSNTIIMPGEKVKFMNLSSEVTEEITWILPGATPESSHENSLEVVYETEGIYPATLIAKNSEGEDIKKVDQLIVVTKKAKEIKNLALNKPTSASSFVPSEPPSQAVDGTVENNSKWCAVGDLPHWLDIDFEKEVIINKVVIKHAESGYESPDWNTQSFKIQVSLDGETWEDVVKVENNTKGITEHSFSPVNARYLRFFIEKPTQVGDSAARIYEVEVYGLESF
ncbi:MAG: glycoside hydrolase, partial [Clostridia bacterium]|nr:glycoside hydrolase [Clostridia bacterium]